jgi:hypothetical protein
MRQKPPEMDAHSSDREQVEEFRRLLQTDNIAPVDTATYGKRLAEIIQRATMSKARTRWHDDD